MFTLFNRNTVFILLESIVYRNKYIVNLNLSTCPLKRVFVFQTDGQSDNIREKN